MGPCLICRSSYESNEPSWCGKTGEGGERGFFLLDLKRPPKENPRLLGCGWGG